MVADRRVSDGTRQAVLGGGRPADRPAPLAARIGPSLKEALWARFYAARQRQSAERFKHRQENLGGLAKHYSINPKTVAKWRGRSSVQDLPTGPKQAQSTVLSIADDAAASQYRRESLVVCMLPALTAAATGAGQPLLLRRGSRLIPLSGR